MSQSRSTHPPPARLGEFAAGMRDTVPMMVGAAPFGVIFGTLVTTGPLAPWHGELMSFALFAGSAQFIALGLIAGGASYAVVLATTFVVNLRHLLYSATLAPYVAHLPLRWRATLGALMTDEVFAVAYAHYRHAEPGATGPYHFFGSGVAMYVNWQVWTIAGLLFGAAFPRLQSLGLDFAMAATFIAIVVPQLASLRNLAAAVTAGAVALLCRAWPYKLGLLAAVAAGVAIGVALTWFAEQRARRRAEAAS
ncbi:branched-chain amino acid ABC transporter permease [Burkholderia savannae]|nr:branched-chain amino acid ABC transporter permease [Burkholderia savannae]